MTKIVMYSLLPIALDAVRHLDTSVTTTSIKTKLKGFCTQIGLPGVVTDFFINQIAFPMDTIETFTTSDQLTDYLETHHIPGTCVNLVIGTSIPPDTNDEVTECVKGIAATAFAQSPLVTAVDVNKKYAFALQITAFLSIASYLIPAVAPGLPVPRLVSVWLIWLLRILAQFTTLCWALFAVYIGDSYRMLYLILVIATILVHILKMIVGIIPGIGYIVNSFVFAPTVFWLHFLMAVFLQYIPLYHYFEVQHTVKYLLELTTKKS